MTSLALPLMVLLLSWSAGFGPSVSVARAEIVTGPCSCYSRGVQLAPTPTVTCNCTCEDEWLPPRCNYRAAMTVAVRLYVTPQVEAFSSERFVQSIRAALGDATASFRSLKSGGATYDARSVNAVVVVLRGAFVVPFLNAVETSQAWTAALGIVAADLETKLPATPWESHQVMIYDDGYTTQLSLSSIGFFAGAILICLVLPCCELGCCSGYSTAEMEHAWETEQIERKYAAADLGAAAGSPSLQKGAASFGQSLEGGNRANESEPLIVVVGTVAATKSTSPRSSAATTPRSPQANAAIDPSALDGRSAATSTVPPPPAPLYSPRALEPQQSEAMVSPMHIDETLPGQVAIDDRIEV